VGGIRQQCHRARDHHHRKLRQRGQAERDQTDLDRTVALRTGLQRGIKGVCGVVRVRARHVGQTVSQSRSAVSAEIVFVLVNVVAPLPVAGILEAHCSPRRDGGSGVTSSW